MSWGTGARKRFGPSRYSLAAGVVEAAFVAMLAGCYEEPDPFWLLDEEPLALGYEIEVIMDGPLATSLPTLHPELRRKEPLPLDTVLIKPIVATNDGVLGPSEFVPAWFLCPTIAVTRCERSLADPRTREQMLRPCLTGETHEGCLAGYANPLPMVWPLPSGPEPAPDDVEQWIFFNSFRTLLMVGGKSGGLYTSDCIERLGRRGDDLHGCAIALFSVTSGPSLELFEIFEDNVSFDAPDVEDPDVEDPVYPDVAPAIDGISVSLEGMETYRVRLGEVVRVPHDALVELSPVVDDEQLQTYLVFGPTGFAERSESLRYALYFDEPAIPRHDVSAASFTVPRDIDELTALMLVGDGRNGWSWVEVPIVAD